MFASHTNPIAGWQLEFKPEPLAIEKDCQDYIKSLGLKSEKAGVYAFYAAKNNSEYVAYIEYFKDGTGQHAEKITISKDFTDWEHVLIYDKDGKRIKIVKYISGHSSS